MISDALNRREGKGINLQIYISPDGEVSGQHVDDVDLNDMGQDDLDVTKNPLEGSPDEEKSESPDEEATEKLGLAPEVEDTIPPKGQSVGEDEEAPAPSGLGKMAGLMGKSSLASRMMKKKF